MKGVCGRKEGRLHVRSMNLEYGSCMGGVWAFGFVSLRLAF